MELEKIAKITKLTKFDRLLKSIITTQRDNPIGYSFAIDGEWSCGKTWVLNELEK